MSLEKRQNCFGFNQLETEETLREESIPLIRQFLLGLEGQRIIITTQDWEAIKVQDSKVRESYYLSLVNNFLGGDHSGILAWLLGFSKDPEQTKRIIQVMFDRIKIANFERDFPRLASILDGNQLPKLDDLSLLKFYADRIVRYIKELPLVAGIRGGMTEEYSNFRGVNDKILDKLKERYGNNLDNLLRRRPDFDGWRLVNVFQAPIMPPPEFIPQGHFEGLQAILPGELNRNINPDPPSANTLLGFFAKIINMMGNDVNRGLLDLAQQKLIFQQLSKFN